LSKGPGGPIATEERHEEVLGATATVPEHVVFRSFEAETLLLNLETGQYHGLNATGGRMLELLKETGGEVSASVAQLAKEYELEVDAIATDMADFCLSLEDRGLLEVQRR
jgi:hypothetical protein